MRSDGEYLTGLWFEKTRDDLKHQGDFEEKDLSIFNETSKWLDIYFSGKEPDFIPKYKIENLTPFRKMVIDIMNKIDYFIIKSKVTYILQYDITLLFIFM